jgi:CheY-like chemotaxis protein
MTAILFVDDDLVTLELMGQAARLLGYPYHLARSGEKAFELLRKEKPILIFLDMMMPDMDGLSVLKELKKDKDFGEIPVIILSAGASYNDSIVCLNEGASEYLLKPVPLQALMDIIKKYETKS